MTLRFRGREMRHRDLGAKLLERVRDDLAELGTVEQFPKMEGRQMTMVLAPKKEVSSDGDIRVCSAWVGLTGPGL